MQYVCVLIAFVFLLGHSNEENDVLQHACTECSEKPGRDPAQSDREGKNYVTATRRMHQDTPSHP